MLTATLTISQTLEETYNPPANAQGATLSLTLRLEFAVQVVSARDLTRLAELSLDAALPQGFSPAPGTLTFQPVTIPVTDAQDVTRWQMQAERLIFRSVDTAQVLSLALGRPPAQVQRLIARIQPFSNQPEVRLTPAWWPWLPLIPLRVQVVIQ
jgi:hypothetical protein